MPGETKKKGWGFVSNSSRWHFFDKSSTTLCGKFWVPGLAYDELEDTDHGNAQNCKACEMKRQKLYGNA
jgi:hypothetical protein